MIENPVITCTQLQLAFAAWMRGLGSDDLSQDGVEWELFNMWWDENHNSFSSLMDACEKAWHAAQDDLFCNWWQSIVDSQPKVTNE